MRWPGYSWARRCAALNCSLTAAGCALLPTSTTRRQHQASAVRHAYGRSCHADCSTTGSSASVATMTLTLDELDAACARLAGCDASRAMAIARMGTSSEAEALSLLAEVEARVAQAAEGLGFRNAVTRVAEALILHRELDGEQITALLNEQETHNGDGQ
jgi:hypothetical protein